MTSREIQPEQIHTTRCTIEPAIGHMKSDGRLARNPLKGAIGDALHAVMCGADHNIRLLLKKLRLLCAR
jgi:IS5 family transposase